MYKLQLFDASDLDQPIDARLLAVGSMTIGRDPSANWSVNDPKCVLSRHHCELFARPDGLALSVKGTNGMYIGDSRDRLPHDTETLLPLPCSLELGDFKLVATVVAFDAQKPRYDPAPPTAPSTDRDDAWQSDGQDASATAPAQSGSLLEAFCQGAGIDSSLLSSDEPEEIMRRAGAIYREVVIGIGDLMAERDQARIQFEMNRTTIAGKGNNPFKWSPSQRLALDLLLSGPSSFLSGPAAVRSSFRDLKRHLVASIAGFKDTLRAAVQTFSPSELERAVPEKSSLLKSRASEQMDEVRRRYEDLWEQLEEGREGLLDRSFMRGYDAAEFADRSAQQ